MSERIGAFEVGRVVCGDAVELLKGLPDGCVNAVVTDPPYGIDFAEWDVAPDAAFLAECLRVATGPVVMFGASPPRSMNAFLALDPERMLVWAPSFTLAGTQSKRMFFKWHPVWCWRLPSVHDAFHEDVLRDQTDCGAWWYHPCTKPAPLMRKLVALAPPVGALVLDPFAGSGTTGVACVQTGRRFIGCDIDPGYCDVANRRIAEAEAQPRLFDAEPAAPPEQLSLGVASHA